MGDACTWSFFTITCLLFNTTYSNFTRQLHESFRTVIDAHTPHSNGGCQCHFCACICASAACPEVLRPPARFSSARWNGTAPYQPLIPPSVMHLSYSGLMTSFCACVCIPAARPTFLRSPARFNFPGWSGTAPYRQCVPPPVGSTGCPGATGVCRHHQVQHTVWGAPHKRHTGAQHGSMPHDSAVCGTPILHKAKCGGVRFG
jgi:hypothetical protein